MKNIDAQYSVALFDSVHHVFSAEQVLKQAGVPHKIVPIPRNISSDCGFCIRFLPEHGELLKNTLMGKTQTYTIRSL